MELTADRIGAGAAVFALFMTIVATSCDEFRRIDAEIDMRSRDVNRRFDTIDSKIDAVQNNINGIAIDMAFMAGRQAERDLQADAQAEQDENANDQ